MIEQRQDRTGADAADQRSDRNQNGLQRLLASPVDLQPVEADHREDHAQQRRHHAHALQQQVGPIAGDPGIQFVEDRLAREGGGSPLVAGGEGGQHPIKPRKIFEGIAERRSTRLAMVEFATKLTEQAVLLPRLREELHAQDRLDDEEDQADADDDRPVIGEISDAVEKIVEQRPGSVRDWDGTRRS